MTSTNDERRAVIDVGTNSVKLLVATVGRRVSPILKLSRQTRLGGGSFKTNRLQPDAIARTVGAIAELATEAARLTPESLRVFATSAARDTSNGGDLLAAVRHSTGLEVEIISGEEEARLAFRGVSSDGNLFGTPLLIVDVGGGSTEWVAGEGDIIYYCTGSGLLGTARLLELHPVSDPPTPAELADCRAAVREFMVQHVRPHLWPVLELLRARHLRAVGLGGTLKCIARLASAPEPPGASLSREALRQQIEHLWHRSSAERRRLPGLAPEKADVALAGTVIYEALLVEFGFPQVHLSQHGVREGALLEPARIPPTSPPEHDPARLLSLV